MESSVLIPFYFRIHPHIKNYAKTERSSHLEKFHERAVLNNLKEFTGKYLHWNAIFE